MLPEILAALLPFMQNSKNPHHVFQVYMWPGDQPGLSTATSEGDSDFVDVAKGVGNKGR
jgi:hypothetical protein